MLGSHLCFIGAWWQGGGKAWGDIDEDHSGLGFERVDDGFFQIGRQWNLLWAKELNADDADNHRKTTFARLGRSNSAVDGLQALRTLMGYVRCGREGSRPRHTSTSKSRWRGSESISPLSTSFLPHDAISKDTEILPIVP